jgi:hypothetical protein
MRTQWRGHLECVRECDLCGERGCRSGEVGSDAGDDRAGDREGEKSEGGTLGGEGRAAAEDWVSAGVIKVTPACHKESPSAQRRPASIPIEIAHADQSANQGDHTRRLGKGQEQY